MSTGTIVFICILVVLIAGVVALYFLGKRAQKKQAEQQEMLQANKQTVSMLTIDKKRIPLFFSRRVPWIFVKTVFYE